MRAGLSERVRVDAEDRMTAQLLELLGAAGAKVVATYVGVGSEVRTVGFREAWRAIGGRVALPRVVGDAIVFHLVEDDTALVAGYRGVPEPPQDAPAAGFPSLDVVIVPGVGFDPEGRRLGQGGGFYDRLLAGRAAGRPLAIGLAYPVQMIPRVPCDPHDQRVDVVVTGGTPHG